MLDYDRVEARGLVQTFGATRALAGLDADFKAGEVTVVEGPNGAGKSTLLAVLSLLVRPVRGALRFGPHDAVASADRLRGTIGILAHASMVYPDLDADETLALTATLYGLEEVDAARRIEALRARFELGAFADRPARTYSRGQRQRLALARALLVRPRLLLLDEPSTGLDAASTARLVDIIHEERVRGAIVVVVTHDAAFASAIATRTLRIARGRAVAVPSRSEKPA